DRWIGKDGGHQVLAVGADGKADRLLPGGDRERRNRSHASGRVEPAHDAGTIDEINAAGGSVRRDGENRTSHGHVGASGWLDADLCASVAVGTRNDDGVGSAVIVLGNAGATGFEKGKWTGYRRRRGRRSRIRRPRRWAMGNRRRPRVGTDI